MASSERFPISVIAAVLALVFVCRQPATAAKDDDESQEKRDDSSTSLKLKKQSSSTQNQNSLGSPLGNAVDNPASLFSAGEVQILGFGIGGYGQSTHNITEEHTVQQTTTVTETHFKTTTSYKRTFVPSSTAPGFFVLTPVQTTVPVTTSHQVTTTHKVKTTKNVAGIQGGFGGAGAEARYFLTRWLGVGLEGDWLDGEGSSGTTMTTITARLVRNANAYYVFGGAGVQFNDDYTQSIGKLGLGVEHRFIGGTGLFADAAWLFGSHENAATFRGGVRFKF